MSKIGTSLHVRVLLTIKNFFVILGGATILGWVFKLRHMAKKFRCGLSLSGLNVTNIVLMTMFGVLLLVSNVKQFVLLYVVC